MNQFTSYPEEDSDQLISRRRAKLARLRREHGFAYPNDFVRNAHAGELRGLYGALDGPELLGREIRVALAGRLMSRRIMGRAGFADLMDFSGKIQLYCPSKGTSDILDRLRELDIGDLIGIEGLLMKTHAGELTVQVERMILLSKCLRPLPEKYHGLTDAEQRYRRRYVDLLMNPETRRIFIARSRIVTHLRRYLDSLDFLEVETPMMQPIPGGAVARPFVTHHHALDIDLFLRVAPELYLKRLIVGGFERVYEINRNFRNEGISARHNPEFTMLELYQAYATGSDIMNLTENLIRSVAENVMGQTTICGLGYSVDLAKRFERRSLMDLVLEHNPGLVKNQLRDADYLRQVLMQMGTLSDDESGPGALLMTLFEKTVESKLNEPTFVTEHPLEVSPLSRPAQDSFFADRFELYICGRELANGFSELNDPDDQAERFRRQLQAHHAGDLEAMHFDQDYIEALEYGMPPTGGLGIGVDRLIMLMTGVQSIREVLLFPLLKPL
ncbi:MAG: lysine--tRNA ligase [Gammaproteobacteria bacterium]